MKKLILGLSTSLLFLSINSNASIISKFSGVENFNTSKNIIIDKHNVRLSNIKFWGATHLNKLVEIQDNAELSESKKVKEAITKMTELSTAGVVDAIKKVTQMEVDYFNNEVLPLLDKVMEINLNFEELLNQPNNIAIKEIIKGARLLKLVELCKMVTNCQQVLRYALSTDDSRRAQYLQFTQTIDTDLFVNYDNKKCDIDDRSIRELNLSSVDTINLLDRIEQANQKNGKLLKVSCEKKWTGEAKLKFKKSKHLINYVVRILHPLDPWQTSEIHPEEKLRDLLNNNL